MALRLVLVGVVASLGLTLPSRSSLEAWTRAGRGWVHAKFADSGTHRPVEKGAFIFVAEALEPVRPKAEVAEAAPGDMGLKALVDEWVEASKGAAKSSRSQLVACEWISLEGFESLAGTLPEERVEKAVPMPRLTPVAGLEAEVEAWLDDALKAREPIAVRRDAPVVTEAAKAEAAAKRREVAERNRAFDSVMDETIAAFGADLAEAAKRADLAEAATKAALAEATRKAAEAAELARSFDAAVDEIVASFGDDAPADAPTTRVARRTAPAFEPMVVGEDLYPGVAYALNRASEGIGESAPAAVPAPEAGLAARPRAEAVPPRSRLATAVKLTREAVNAWASVLHGPAVVTISR